MPFGPLISVGRLCAPPRRRRNPFLGGKSPRLLEDNKASLPSPVKTSAWFELPARSRPQPVHGPRPGVVSLVPAPAPRNRFAPHHRWTRSHGLRPSLTASKSSVLQQLLVPRRFAAPTQPLPHSYHPGFARGPVFCLVLLSCSGLVPCELRTPTCKPLPCTSPSRSRMLLQLLRLTLL